MNLKELAAELSSMTSEEKSTRMAEIYEDMEEEYGEGADAKFDELEALLPKEKNWTIKLEEVVNGLTFKTNTNKHISVKDAVKLKLPENMRVHSKRGPEAIAKIEKDLEGIEDGLEQTIRFVNDPTNIMLLSNVKLILSKIDEIKSYAITSTISTKKIKIDNFLGGIPLGPVQNRELIYDYWETIDGKYAAVETALEEILSGTVKLSEDEDAEISKDIIDALKPFKGKDLRYVGEFDTVSITVGDPITQLFSYVTGLFTLYNLSNELMQHEGKETGEVTEELNTILAEENRQAYGDVSGEGYSMVDTSLSSDSSDDQLEADFKSDGEKLDPLLAYYFNSPKSDYTQKIIALTEKGYEEIQAKMKQVLDVSAMADDYQSVSLMVEPKILKDIEEIKDTFNIERQSFYLPATIEHSSLKSKEEPEIADILEFLSAVGDLLWEFSPMIPSKSVRRNISNDGPSEAPVVEGHAGISKEGREAMKKLVDAINAYYIAPSYSGRLPVAEVDFVNSHGARKIIAGASNIGATSMEGTAYKKLIESRYSVTKTRIKHIRDYLGSIISGATEINQTLTKKGELAAVALTELFEHETQNNNHMAAILNYVYNETGTDVTGKKFAGRLITTRTEDYELAYGRGEAMPLFMLPAYLMKHKGIIESTDGLKNEVGKLKDILRTVEDLPVVLKGLLKAHDIVRELKGLETVYAFRPLTIDHSEEVITKMYKEFNVDLSYSEIDRIVTEVNSFSDMAKSLGVSEEIVYQVKAQFR